MAEKRDSYLMKQTGVVIKINDLRLETISAWLEKIRAGPWRLSSQPGK
jgi:hypothetical protein